MSCYGGYGLGRCGGFGGYGVGYGAGYGFNSWGYGYGLGCGYYRPCVPICNPCGIGYGGWGGWY